MQPRRSCLSVPGSSERKLAKAATLEVDEIVIDLEDSVPARHKEDARAAAVHALSAWAGPAVAVRVNAARLPWCHLDVAAVAAVHDPRVSIVLPKVEGPGDLAFLDRLLDGVEAGAGGGPPMRVQALIETAAGLARAQEIAHASERLDALILGYADLAASLGASRTPETWLYAQDVVLVAARAAGLQAVDGPHLGIEPDADFEAAAARARDLGFDGKWAIHPSQLETLNRLFTPTAEEVRDARTVLAALERAESQRGEGAVAVEGAMVDEAVALAARRVLARAGEST
jgi:citrate lyase subunit beta/citryl-CoA lyase